MFAICEMVDESETSYDIIPMSWFNESNGTCVWPPVKNSTLYVTRSVPPASNWKSYPARILHQYNSYKDARANLNRAQDTSDLNTDTEETPKKRKYRTGPKRISYEEMSEEEAPISGKTALKRSCPQPPEVAKENQELGIILGNSTTTAVQPVSPSNIPTFVLVTGTEQHILQSPAGNSTTTTEEVQHCSSEEIINQPLLPQPHSSTSASYSWTTDAAFISHLQGQGLGTVSGLGSSLPETGINSQGRTVEPLMPPPVSDETQVLLKKLITDVGTLTQYVCNLDRKVDSMRTDMPRPPYLDRAKSLPLPFTTLTAFETFEANISEEDAKALEVCIRNCGGDSTVEFAGRALKKVISDEVAVFFSLRGKKGNKSFAETRMWSILRDVILGKTKLNADEKMIEKAVSEWFRHANERLKKKQALS